MKYWMVLRDAQLTFSSWYWLTLTFWQALLTRVSLVPQGPWCHGREADVLLTELTRFTSHSNWPTGDLTWCLIVVMISLPWSWCCWWWVSLKPTWYIKPETWGWHEQGLESHQGKGESHLIFKTLYSLKGMIYQTSLSPLLPLPSPLTFLPSPFSPLLILLPFPCLPCQTTVWSRDSPPLYGLSFLYCLNWGIDEERWGPMVWSVGAVV